MTRKSLRISYQETSKGTVTSDTAELVRMFQDELDCFDGLDADRAVELIKKGVKLRTLVGGETLLMNAASLSAEKGRDRIFIALLRAGADWKQKIKNPNGPGCLIDLLMEEGNVESKRKVMQILFEQIKNKAELARVLLQYCGLSKKQANSVLPATPLRPPSELPPLLNNYPERTGPSV